VVSDPYERVMYCCISIFSPSLSFSCALIFCSSTLRLFRTITILWKKTSSGTSFVVRVGSEGCRTAFPLCQRAPSCSTTESGRSKPNFRTAESRTCCTNCAKGMSIPRTAACGSACSKPLGSGATVRRLPSSNWMSAVASEMVFTTPMPYCGCRTFMPICKASIFMPGI